MVRLAAAPPWLLLIFWGFILLVARAGKKKAPPRQPLARRTGVDDSRVELGDAFQRAMEKLKEAERESRPSRALRRLPEPETVNYDEEAVQLEEKRVQEEAEAFERGDVGLSPRVIAGPVTQVVHSVRVNPLRRYADGTLRSAVVLSEILGRPIADR